MATSLEHNPQPRLAAVPESRSENPGIDDIFRLYARYVAAIGRTLLGNDDEADDLVQEVFLVAVRRIELLREPLAIKGWLATIAVRVARKRLRRRRLLDYVSWTKRSYENLVTAAANPEQRLFLTQVYDELDKLPVDHRIAWTLRHLEGERLDVVARLCGCSLATAKRRIAAAHERLQKVVGP